MVSASPEKPSNGAASVPVMKAWTPSAAIRPTSALTPTGIEVSGDLVEQQHRRAAGQLGDQRRLGQDQTREQCLLLAGRGGRGWHVLFGVADRQVGAMGADERPTSRPVARTTCPEIGPQPVLDIGGSRAIESRINVAESTGRSLAEKHRRHQGASQSAERGSARSRDGPPRWPHRWWRSRFRPHRARPYRPRGPPASGCEKRRPAHKAETRRPCVGSTASTKRSRKRRRSPAGPTNRPSMAGISQIRRR